MQFTPTRTFTALALIFGALTATNTGAVRPVPVADGTKLITPAWTPVGLSNQSVTVVVQLAGDPVAVQQESAGRKLTRSEKDQAKNKLKGNQNAVRGSIEKLGGTVLASYQSSYNGVKVRIARDKAAQLATLPGVTGVRPLQIVRPNNTNGVPLIGAPGVWQSSGFHGENVKIAIIDTGIDYTHKNFGGPGTVTAYNTAHGAETSPANPAWFGPLAPRIKGGIDLVGDSYNADPDSATYQPIPHPDPNPLDCQGHGSHVAGTAAGSGVTAAGATYTGPYNATTISSNSWNVGPGVAPKADLYAIRVFGCDGSTDMTVDAIEWAVDNDMDVINMSLGSSFGTKDDPSAVASTNAAKAGVIVVTSTGNSGPGQYIAGSPGTATGAIATAANDPSQTFPAATITIPSGPMTAINANGYPFTVPLGYTVRTIVDNPATPGNESLGCSAADFSGPLPANTIAVVNRGVCARVAKAIFGQQAGAAAVVMVNNSTALPPFEGKITVNPDDGIPYLVTIPFLGVRGTNAASDGGRLKAANGQAATVAGSAPLVNPAFTAFGSFSSGGPRTGDSNLKPDITAPGVSIVSTSSGSGFEGTTLSGTSMASPHVAGVAALMRQAHPNWKVEDVKAVIVNTGLPSGVLDYRTSRGGTGLVQPVMSTKSQVSAFADDRRFAVAVNFGFEELKDDFSDRKTIKLKNHGSTAATFNVAQALPAGSPHTVTLNKTSVRVPARGDAEVEMRLKVPAATAGNSTQFREVAGLIQFTPASAADNGNVTLRVPYYMVPRAKSDISTQLGKFQGNDPATVAIVTNKRGVIAGNADFYAWGLEDKKNRQEREEREDRKDHKDATNVSHDIRAVGVQSFPFDADEAIVVFAVNTYNRWSNASTNEFDLTVDVDGDGTVDYIVVGVDFGAVTAGVFNGQMGSFVFSTRSGGASIEFLADAPTDSSTALLPVLASQLCRPGEPCLNAANPRITYGATSFDLVNGGIDPVDGTAKFNVWSSSISTGGFATVAPAGTDSSNVIAIDSAEWALTPALGVMVVSTDNKSGKDEAQLLDVKIKK